MPYEQHLLLLAFLISFGAFSTGFMGLGFGIIVLGGAAFTSLDLERVSVVVNLLFLGINASIIFAGRKEARINWRMTVLMIAGETVGVPLGYWFILAFGNTPIFRFSLGFILAGFAANEFLRPQIRKQFHQGYGLLAGAFGGFCTGSFVAGGPAYALYLYSQAQDPKKAKGTLQVVFMTATVWRIIAIVCFGKGLTSNVLTLTGLAFPLVIAFTVLGHALSRRVSAGVFRRVVFGFIGIVGIMHMVGIK